MTLDVDRYYIGSVTATTHQEKGIITLESNPSRGTVLPGPHDKACYIYKLTVFDSVKKYEESMKYPDLKSAPIIKAIMLTY